jgi:hypothetical protein
MSYTLATTTTEPRCNRRAEEDSATPYLYESSIGQIDAISNLKSPVSTQWAIATLLKSYRRRILILVPAGHWRLYGTSLVGRISEIRG